MNYCESPCNGVTLLVCTFNGANRLQNVIQYISRQKVDINTQWEVLIVSNASKDDTIEVANLLCQKFLLNNISYRVLDEVQPGKENALALGLNEALYEAVAIVDDDNLLALDYTQTAFDIMQAHPEIGILGARGEGVFEVPPPIWFEAVQAVYAVGPQNRGVNGPYPSNDGYIYGAGSVIRRSAWLKLKSSGFAFLTHVQRGKTIAGGEDMELGEALKLAGYKLWYDERLQFQHFIYENRLSWNYLLRIGLGGSSSLLVSIVYYFMLRNPNLSETKFFLLYLKHVLRLILILGKQAANISRITHVAPSEGDIIQFENLRTLNNFKISSTQYHAALRIFRQVREWEKKLNMNINLKI